MSDPQNPPVEPWEHLIADLADYVHTATTHPDTGRCDGDTCDGGPGRLDCEVADQVFERIYTERAEWRILIPAVPGEGVEGNVAIASFDPDQGREFARRVGGTFQHRTVYKAPDLDTEWEAQ